MLANTFVLIGIIALALTTMFGAVGALANVTVRRIAAHYADGGYTWAAHRIHDEIAAQIRAGAAPNGPFASLAPATYCATPAQPCDFSIDPQIDILSANLPSAAPACAAGQSCALNLQKNPYVNEARVTARIVVLVTAANGALLARRERYLALRTLAAPPYVAGIGASDDAGLPGPATPVPCASPDPAATFTQNTIVSATYQNAQTGACINGSTWSSQAWQNPSEVSATP